MSNLEMITDEIVNLDINRAINACINNNCFLMHTNTVHGIFSHILCPNMEKKMDERKKISSTIPNITNYNDTSDQRNILPKHFFTIHCYSWDDATQYWADNQQHCCTIKKLTSSCFAGYITIIAASKQDIQQYTPLGQHADNVDANNKVGIRVPCCAKVQRVLKTLGVPLIATSANIHGCLPLMQTQEMCNTFPNIEMILLNCNCTMGLDSTVLELTNGNIYVKRRGIIPLQLISEAIGENVIIDNRASYEHMFWSLDGKRNIVAYHDRNICQQSDDSRNMKYIDHFVCTIQFIKNNQCYKQVVNIRCYFGTGKQCIYCFGPNHNNIITTPNNNAEDKHEIFLCSNMMCNYIDVINSFIQDINNTKEKIMHCIWHDHYKKPGEEILYNVDGSNTNTSFIEPAHMLFQFLLLLMRNAYTNSK